jgi:hypothetical protein
MNDDEKMKRYIKENFPGAVEEVMKLSDRIVKQAMADIGNPGSANTYALNAFSLFFSNFLTAYIKPHSDRPIQGLGNEIYEDFQKALKEILLKHSGGKRIIAMDVLISGKTKEEQ